MRGGERETGGEREWTGKGSTGFQGGASWDRIQLSMFLTTGSQTTGSHNPLPASASAGVVKAVLSYC